MSSDNQAYKTAIEQGQTAIGIEVGSTRIKTVLIDQHHTPLASGSHEWENSYSEGIWTYRLEALWKGVQDSYAKMAKNAMQLYGVPLRLSGAIGFSGMMHGYMVFDKAGELLTPFRTWRNTITEKASEELSALFRFPIPQRWSIAHLYQAILNAEPHVKDIDYMTTVAGYIHWMLTGNKIVGVGEASGMFPIDSASYDFDAQRLALFDAAVADRGFSWKLKDILPRVLQAGDNGGVLTPQGALLLDPSGQLQAGIPMCPPEGDAGTGMVATNSVAQRTGNVSTGTSVFAMVVLEKDLSAVYPVIDMVTTPDGKPVAMVHSNNCSTDYDAWLNLFGEAMRAMGVQTEKQKLFETLLGKALEADADCGGLLSYGYVSGEHVTGFEEGRPLFVRSAESSFTLANFMRVQLFTALGALRTGMDVLFEKEAVHVDEIFGHGGFFKIRQVGQKIMSAALNVPVSVMETAGEGGAWGIAILASYMKNKIEGETLDAFLKERVFSGKPAVRVLPEATDVAGFNRFFERYTQGLPIMRAAVDHMKQ